MTITSVNGFTRTVGLNAPILPVFNGGPTVSLSQTNLTLTLGGSAVATLTIAGGNATLSPLQRHSAPLLFSTGTSLGEQAGAEFAA